MTTQDAPSFDANIISQSLEAARRHSDALRWSSTTGAQGFVDGELKVSAQCIDVTVATGQACLNLPLGIGHYCFPIPQWVPNGTAAKACLQICTVLGVPCGIEVTISALGQPILQKGFGCSC